MTRPQRGTAGTEASDGNRTHRRIALAPNIGAGRNPEHTANPPRSVDRTQSPVAVSQKREYFKYPPETIGDFAPKLFKLGV